MTFVLNLDKRDLLQSNRTIIHELKKLLVSTNVIKLIAFSFHEVTLILINIDLGSSVCPLHTLVQTEAEEVLQSSLLLCHINASIMAGSCLG